MDGSQVLELIHLWRELSAQLEAKNRRLEDVRNALASQKEDYGKVKDKWDLEKVDIKGTIHTILDEVTRKKDELKRMECDTAALKAKVEERVKRNGEHQRILAKRKSVVEDKIKLAEREDAGEKESYKNFLRSRDSHRQQLQNSIGKASENLKAILKAHQDTVESIKVRNMEISKTIDAESKAWILEQAMDCWTAKTDARQRHLTELTDATNGKANWTDVLQGVNSLSSDLDSSSLHELRSLLEI